MPLVCNTEPVCKALICCGEDSFENYSAAGSDAELFFNQEVSYTSQCPPQYNCITATVTIPANANKPATNNPPTAAQPPGPAPCLGPFTGATQAEANAAALACAQAAANAQTQILGPIIYYNTEQTANCPSGFFGNPVVIPANSTASMVSVAAANAEALRIAQGQLSCCVNPIAWWRLEELDGTRPESMGVYPNLALVQAQGTATGAAGKIMNGAFMTSAGASQQLQSGNSHGLAYSGNGMTITAWINWDGSASSTFQFGITLKDSSFNTIGFFVYDGANSTLQINSPLESITVANPVLVGGWNQIILSYHEDTQKITVRTNNGSVVESAGTMAFPSNSDGQASFLYFHPTGGTGAYDEVGVFNYDLSTACEVLLWNAGSGRTFGTLFPPPPCTDNPISALTWLLDESIPGVSCVGSSASGGSLSFAGGDGTCEATATLLGSCDEYTASIEIVSYTVATTGFFDGPSNPSGFGVDVDGVVEFTVSEIPAFGSGCTSQSGGPVVVNHVIPAGAGTHLFRCFLTNGSLQLPPGPCVCSAVISITPLTPP